MEGTAELKARLEEMERMLEAQRKAAEAEAQARKEAEEKAKEKEAETEAARKEAEAEARARKEAEAEMQAARAEAEKFRNETALLHALLEDRASASLPSTPGATRLEPLSVRKDVERGFRAPYQRQPSALSPEDMLTYLQGIGSLGVSADVRIDKSVALVQSSGYGKSRLVRELARLHFVSYFCVAEEGQQSWPPANLWGSELLLAAKRSISEEALEAKLMEVLDANHKASHRYELPDEWWHAQQIPVTAKVERQESVCTCSDHDNRKLRILIFDEAASLLKPIDLTTRSDFTAFRGLRRIIAKSTNTVGVFLSTNSQLQNFAPSKKRYGSGRPSNELHCLPKPIWSLGWNIFAKQAKVTTLRQCGAMKELAKYGRGLWHAANYLPQDIQDCLSAGGRDSDAHFNNIAIAALTAGMSFTPSTRLAEVLLQKHFATLKWVDEDRERIIIHYPGEPPLAAAAFTLLKSRFPSVLKSVQRLLLDGFANPGEAGELVARFTLLWQLRSLDQESWVMPLDRFWPGASENINVPTYLGFTHFWTPNEKQVTQLLLAEALRRRAAIVPRQRQVAFDLIIPVYCGDPDALFESSAVTGMFVQVKNRLTKVPTFPLLENISSYVDEICELGSLPKWAVVIQKQHVAPAILAPPNKRKRLIREWTNLEKPLIPEDMPANVGALLKDILEAHVSVEHLVSRLQWSSHDEILQPSITTFFNST